MKCDQNKQPDGAVHQPERRRPYSAPKLQELGSLEELTQGASGTSPDGDPFAAKN